MAVCVGVTGYLTRVGHPLCIGGLWLSSVDGWIALCMYSTDSMEGTYAAVGWMMRLCLLTQLLEVLHPIVGYTRGPVFPALAQVGFRGGEVAY